MLYNRLFRQVDRGWMGGLRVLLLLLLLFLGETRRFSVSAGCLLPVPSNEAPEEP